MKGVIAGFCALSAIANAQFNVQINNGGLRVGILGSEVANVGGQNQQKPFSTGSWPIEVSQVLPFTSLSLPTLEQHNSAQTPKTLINAPQIISKKAKFGSVTPNFQKQNTIKDVEPTQIISTIIKQQVENQNAKKSANDAKDIQKIDSEIAKQQEIKQKQKQKQTVIQQNIEEVQATFNLKQNKQIKPTNLQKADDKQNEQKKLQQLWRLEDQRVLKFVHLMPEQTKKHLKAISSDRSQF